MFHFQIFLVPCSEKLTLLPQARFLSDWQWESGLNRNSPPLNAGSLPWEALDAAAQLLVCQRDVIRLLQSAGVTPNNLTSEKCVRCISKIQSSQKTRKRFRFLFFTMASGWEYTRHQPITLTQTGKSPLKYMQQKQ